MVGVAKTSFKTLTSETLVQIHVFFPNGALGTVRTYITCSKQAKAS